MASLPGCSHQDEDVAALRERLLRDGEISASQQEILANLPGWESDDYEETTSRGEQPAAPEAAEQPAINPFASWTVSRSNVQAQGGFPMQGNPPAILSTIIQRGNEEHDAAMPDAAIETAEARDQHVVENEPCTQVSPHAELITVTPRNRPSSQPRFLSRFSAGFSFLLGMSGRKSNDSAQARQYQTQPETPSHDMSPGLEDFFQTPESQPSRLATVGGRDDEATHDDGADTRHKASPPEPARDTQDTQVLSDSQIAGSSKADVVEQTALSNYCDAPESQLVHEPRQHTKPAKMRKQTKSTPSHSVRQPTLSTQSAPAAAATAMLKGADMRTNSSSSRDNMQPQQQQQQQNCSKSAPSRLSPPVGIGSKVLEAALLAADAAASAAEVVAAAAPNTSIASAPAHERAAASAATVVNKTTVTVTSAMPPASKALPEIASDQPQAKLQKSRRQAVQSTTEVVTIAQVLAPSSQIETASPSQKQVLVGDHHHHHQQQHAEPSLVHASTTSSRPSTAPPKAASTSAAVQVEGSGTRKRPMEQTMLEAMQSVLKLQPPKAQSDPYRWLELTGLTRHRKYQRL